MQAKSSQIHNHHNQNSNKWSKLPQKIDYGSWQLVKWSQESEAQPREWSENLLVGFSLSELWIWWKSGGECACVQWAVNLVGIRVLSAVFLCSIVAFYMMPKMHRSVLNVVLFVVRIRNRFAFIQSTTNYYFKTAARYLESRGKRHTTSAFCSQ